jgi:phage shock protein C
VYCSSCGIELTDSNRFCPQCGTSTSLNGFVSSTGAPRRHLSRPRDDQKIAGVSAGIARYLGVDVTLIRILTVVCAFYPPGLSVLLYIACWIVMPRDPLLLPASSVSSNVTASPVS